MQVTRLWPLRGSNAESWWNFVLAHDDFPRVPITTLIWIKVRGGRKDQHG
jgi:hypothetical protein